MSLHFVFNAAADRDFYPGQSQNNIKFRLVFSNEIEQFTGNFHIYKT